MTASPHDLMMCLQPLRTGKSFPALGVTMAGVARMNSIADLIGRLKEQSIEGSYLEAGVWRGGMSIFATAAMRVLGVYRPIYLADSFQGLPLPRTGSTREDEVRWKVYDSSPTRLLGLVHPASRPGRCGTCAKTPIVRLLWVWRRFWPTSLPMASLPAASRRFRATLWIRCRRCGVH